MLREEKTTHLSVLDHLPVGGLLPGALLLEQRQGVRRDDPLRREVVHLKKTDCVNIEGRVADPLSFHPDPDPAY